MKRKLILIFNDGGPGNYLPGVKIDKENYYTDYGYVDSYTEGGVLEALSAYYGNDLMEINLTPLEDGFVCLLSADMYNEILENRETYG